MAPFLLLLLFVLLIALIAKRYAKFLAAKPPLVLSRSTFDSLRAERLYDSSPTQRSAPANGEPLFIGYGDLEVISPNGQHIVQWLYEGELHFGDSINSVWIDGVQLPGLFRGTLHAWSPDSDYFTVERYDPKNGGLFVVRVHDKHWFRVNHGSSVTSFSFPELSFQEYGGTSSKSTYIFSGSESWVSVS